MHESQAYLRTRVWAARPNAPGRIRTRRNHLHPVTRMTRNRCANHLYFLEGRTSPASRETASMSTSSTLASTSAPIGTDEFQALEQRVLRAVEVVRREREARAAAEGELSRLKQRVTEQAAEIERLERDHAEQRLAAEAAQNELATLQDERAEVRQRIERMLHQMDELL